MDTILVRQCNEAIRALEPWRALLSPEKISTFEQSTISRDGDEWCILSGPDLMWDRAGFGASIEEAVKDFIGPYLRPRS
ncbi:MAG: hypothetical protein CL610_18935 [Anaerolineaceae bacterium]|nr:hypothetical protein [Anaerolineaceae bacterium]